MTAPPRCWGSLTWNDARWHRRLQEAPSLVAEALERVRDPLPAWLRPGPPASPRGLAARLARSLLPPEAPDEPPEWLRADQRLSFARALAAGRTYGAALLADKPGTGKSWIGLALAATLEPGLPIQVLAPATLASQWTRTAQRAGLDVRFHSHELLSRGTAPPASRGPVIVDESHRLRNPATRRYLTLAPWCVGRTGVLLSATPVVNRFEDVLHQLRLFIRDDALAWSGLPDLMQSDNARASGELARVIVTGEDRSGLLPENESSSVRVEDPSPWFQRALSGVLSLSLSRDPAIAALIRVSLLSALGSSPLAFSEALGRYRSLLLHARDALSSGKTISRQTIRQVAGAELDQLVFWSLVAEPSQGVELALEDLERVQELLASTKQPAAELDPKARALVALLTDPKRTLVFSNARATVRYIRNHLGQGIAWCTGERSGIDGLDVARDDVLDLFRTSGSALERVRRPRVLLATDVAAEGLDLPLVARVVHYDLPWTAVRLEQRTGRAFRLGSLHESVEVIRFLPPAELESLLRREEIIARKGALPDQLGLHDTAEAPWKLRARLASAWAGESIETGVAQLSGPVKGFVGCLRIGWSNGHTEELVLARLGAEWIRDLARVAELLEDARFKPASAVPNPRSVGLVLALLARVARQRLRAQKSGTISPASRTPGLAVLHRNLVRLAKEASRRRDLPGLTLAQRGMHWLRRGHTAGECLFIQQWSRLPSRHLRGILADLPDSDPIPAVVSVDLPALLLISPKEEPR